MDAAFARRIFRRQAEGVPAHRVHDQVPARALVARHHIAQRVVPHMAHMDLPRRVGEHLKNIVFTSAGRRHIRHGEAGAAVPFGLPARLCGGEIVARRRGRWGGSAFGAVVGHRLRCVALGKSARIGHFAAQRNSPPPRGPHPGTTPRSELADPGDRRSRSSGRWRYRTAEVDCVRSSRARFSTWSSSSVPVVAETEASTQFPWRSSWRNTTTRTPSERSVRPRI